MVKKRLKKEGVHFAIEIILILAAVLIFRSSWLILDSYDIFNGFTSLVIMLVIGIFVTVISFDYLFQHEKEH